MEKIGKILFFVLLFSFQIAGAVVSVQATVDTNQISLNDSLTLTVSVISDENVTIEPPRLAQIDGFRLDGAHESTSVNQQLMSTPSGMDWKTQRRKEFHYVLTPMKGGRLAIPGLEVKVNGQVYDTQAIIVTASNTPGRKQQQQQQQYGYNWPGGGATLDEIDRLEEEMFNQLLNRGQRPRPVPGQGQGHGRRNQEEPQFRTLPDNPNEAFFVQVEVDKTEVFEGEQVTASWYIYTRGNMESLDRVKFPDLKGFWKEIIEEVPLIQFSEEIINGVPYRKALLASHALFPIKAGTAVIDEYKIKSRIRMPMESFSVGRPNEYVRSSKKVEIKVKPLPEPRPKDFAGAVGQFEIQTAIDGQKFPVNQPFTLRIRFEGNGNAKMIELPPIEWPANLELYDTKAESKFFKDGRSYKQFDLLMIPRKEGVLHIPEISVRLFDPGARKYYQKKTAAIDLNITEGTGGLANAPKAEEQKAAPEKPAGPQLPYIVMSENAGNSMLAVAGTPVALGGFYILIFFGILMKARRELGFGERKKTLRELVDKRFKAVDLALRSQDHKKVGAELMNVFYFLLGEATGQGGAVQELNQLLDLAPPSVRRDMGDKLKKAFDLYQVLCFAPAELVKNYSSSESLRKTVKESRELSNQLIAALTVERREKA